MILAQASLLIVHFLTYLHSFDYNAHLIITNAGNDKKNDTYIIAIYA